MNRLKMRCLLLCLAVVTHLTGATYWNFGDCRVAYFGKISATVKTTTTGSNQTSLCFLESGSNEAGGDCIHIDLEGFVTLQVNTTDCKLVVLIQKEFGALEANLSFSITPNGTQTTLKTAPSYQATNLQILVENKLLQTVNYTGSEISVDLTGCRHQGEFWQTGQQMCNNKTIVSCSAVGEIVEEQCHGREICVPKATSVTPVYECVMAALCNVIGPTIVDFGGGVALAPDLCSYTLLETQQSKIVAEFRERRRTDMGFFHRIILTVRESDNYTNTFIVGPGHQVHVNGTRLNLTHAQTVESTMFFDNSMYVAFTLDRESGWLVLMDDTSVHLIGEGSGRIPEGLQGLCMNSSDAERYKDQEHSLDSCNVVQVQPPDSINCTAQTERCANLLLIPACDGVRPGVQPLFQACSLTLCRYPDEGPLYCHFLKGLAICEAAENYSTEAQCPLNQCSVTFCRDSEFCEVGPSEEPHCRCRAGVYQDFQQRETVCQNQQASVSVPLCVLKEKGLNVSDLHLNQESCQGTIDPIKEQVTFSFDANAQCGTQIQEKGDKILYQNTVQYNSSSEAGIVSRKSSFKLDFSCFYQQPELKTIRFTSKGAGGLQAAIQGSWPYNISVGMFSDLTLQFPIDFSKGIKMNQVIYISMESEGMDGALLLMKADDCYATDRNETGGLKRSLISGGCGNPKDSSIKVFPAKENRGTVIRLKMFNFKGGKGKLFLKCKMKLCLSTSPGCKPNCGNSGKGRRSVDTQEINYDDTGYFVVPL